MKKIWDRWKEKWNVETDRRMVWIFIVFAITGMSIVYIRKPITKFLFSKSTYGELNWYEFILTILMVYLIYQIMLLLVGTLLGEHKFVKWFVIKMNKRLIGKKA